VRARLPAEAGFDSLNELANRCGIVAIQPAVDVRFESVEMMFEPVEPAIDLDELPLEDLDELLVLSVRHGDV